MKIRAVAVVFSLMVFANEGHAQHAGFRIGIAPAPAPMVVQSPVTGFVTSPVTGFGVMPAIIPPFVSYSPNAGFITGFAGFQTPAIAVRSHRVVRNQGVTVIAPGGTVIAPGVTVITPGGGVITPYSIVGPGSVVQGPVIVTGAYVVGQPGGNRNHRNNSRNTGRLDERRTVAIGTPRAHVIEQFGNPSVTIRTRSGETLHYSNGATFIIQNGQVVQTR